MAYASNTSVSPERSRAEIEQILGRYKASHFGYVATPEKAQIGFRMGDKSVRFTLPLPEAKAFERTPKGRARRGEWARRQAYDQELRRRWRALALCIKAKLEAVESGITTFEDEFLAHIVTQSGKTVGEWAVPQLQRVLSGRLALMAGEGGEG
jgi:hypothetical protein